MKRPLTGLGDWRTVPQPEPIKVMKPTFCAIALATLFIAPAAFGQGAAVIIKQRAKETAGRPTTPAPAPAAQPGAATAVAPQATSAQPNVSKLVSELASIKAKPQATAEQKEKFAASLASVATGATKPSNESVQTLASTLADAIAGKKLAAADQAQLARDLGNAMNAAAGSPQMAAAIQGVKDGLYLAGANEASIQAVAKALTGLSTKAK